MNIGISFSTPPPLEEVAPGVRVVPDYDQEVFYANGAYWVQRDGGWYRAADFHGSDWAPAAPAAVPEFIRAHRAGEYRHWHHNDVREHGPAPRFDDRRGHQHHDDRR